VSGEASASFACFGGTVSIHVRDPSGQERLREAREALLDAHRRLSRFDPESELSRLNRDPRAVVPASPLLLKLTRAAHRAGALSGGLVDATLLGEIERLGYVETLRAGEGRTALRPVEPESAPAGPSPEARWRSLAVDEDSGCVVRPPGTRIDSGGIAKGLLADLVGERLVDTRSYAVDCCGDIRLGGMARLPRRIRVGSPFGGPPLREISLREGAVATSGTSRRTWTGPGGRPAHQIIDPATGLSCATGIVQATAVAETALQAEIYAKAALLAGPDAARSWLRLGGVIVLADGSVRVVAGEAELPIPAAT
jgi:thiamine biosynthesis lipoprotein